MTLLSGYGASGWREKNPYRSLVEKPLGKRPLGRSRIRQGDRWDRCGWESGVEETTSESCQVRCCSCHCSYVQYLTAISMSRIWYKLFEHVKLILFNFTLGAYNASTRWFKYDRDWFVCKQAALRSSCATLREWSHNLHPPSCSG